jgi:hypothetical protein
MFSYLSSRGLCFSDTSVGGFNIMLFVDEAVWVGSNHALILIQEY